MHEFNLHDYLPLLAISLKIHSLNVQKWVVECVLCAQLYPVRLKTFFAVLLLLPWTHIVTRGHFSRYVGHYSNRAVDAPSQTICTNASPNRPLLSKHKAIHENSHRFGQPFCNPSMLVATAVAFTLVLQGTGSNVDVPSLSLEKVQTKEVQ